MNLTRWNGETVFVAATGPSLTPTAADLLLGKRVIAVNDAYKQIPSADVLYACDSKWWEVHNGCPFFSGERWSTHEKGGSNDKTAVAKKFGVNIVPGRSGSKFRTDSVIAYGGNSGFQAVGLAILFGAARIVLVGFDMREVAGKRHFFGDHPKPLRNGSAFHSWVQKFTEASRSVPQGVKIVNATTGSAIKCFPFVNLAEEVSHHEMV